MHLFEFGPLFRAPLRTAGILTLVLVLLLLVTPAVSANAATSSHSIGDKYSKIRVTLEYHGSGTSTNWTYRRITQTEWGGSNGGNSGAASDLSNRDALRRYYPASGSPYSTYAFNLSTGYADGATFQWLQSQSENTPYQNYWNDSYLSASATGVVKCVTSCPAWGGNFSTYKRLLWWNSTASGSPQSTNN